MVVQELDGGFGGLEGLALYVREWLVLSVGRRMEGGTHLHGDKLGVAR